MVWAAEPTAWTSHCCQLYARVACKSRGGAAWQMEAEEVVAVAEGEVEGSLQGRGRVEEEMEEGEGEGGAALMALPGARSEAG